MGRETGTEGARLAAEYIAEQMEEIGLQTGGFLESYIQELAAPRAHLASVPVVEMLIPREYSTIICISQGFC